jgi:hypothetical protein
MGLKATDIVPLGANGPTAQTPAAKCVLMKVFQILRTDTTATIKMVLAGAATVVDIQIVGVASNAGTTATVSIGTTATANEWINAQDVKGSGGKIRPSASFGPGLPNFENVPITGDIQVYAKYAETGGASTLGGPYYVFVYYTI